MKKIKYFLISCCFIIAIQTFNIKSGIEVRAEESKNSVLKVTNQIETPQGVEILKTLVRNEVIYAVGITSSTESPYNLDGTEQTPKIFVAQYTMDLKMKKIVDTGYMYSFYSAELYHALESKKTVVKKEKMSRHKFDMHFVNDKLTIVGLANNPEIAQYQNTFETVIQHHKNILVVIQYNEKLDFLQKDAIKFEDYVYNVDYVSIVMNDFIYMTYLPLQPGRFSRPKSELVQYSSSDFTKKKIATINKSETQDLIYKTILPYKDGVVLPYLSNDRLSDVSWDYFSSDLKNNGEIGKDIGGILLKHSFEGASRETVNPSFKMNDGQIYFPERARCYLGDYCEKKENSILLDVAQDEQGRIVTLNINKQLAPELIIHNSRGEITENNLKFDSIDKKETMSMTVSSYQGKVIVVVGQKIYLVEINKDFAVEKSGEFKNACFDNTIMGGDKRKYYDSKNNHCYTLEITPNAGNEHRLKTTILKDGEKFADFDNSKVMKGIKFLSTVASIKTNNDGSLVVEGQVDAYAADRANEPYIAILDKKGNILKEGKPATDLWKRNGEIDAQTKYKDLKMNGKFLICSGEHITYNLSNNEFVSYKIPFVQILDDQLKNVKVLFNEDSGEYKDFLVSEMELLGKHYVKITLIKPKTQEIKHFLYSFKDKNIVKTIDQSVTSEVVLGEKVISVESEQIIEKDTNGKVLSHQPLKIQKAQITPIKKNNQYVVSTVNEQNKLQLHLVDNKGEELKKLETTVEVLPEQVVVYEDNVTHTQEKVNFLIIENDGKSFKKEISTEALKVDENKVNKFIIPIILSSVVIAFLVIIFVFNKKWKKPNIAIVEDDKNITND